MNFNQAEEEYIDGDDTIGLGTLGKEGSGRYADTTTIATLLPLDCLGRTWQPAVSDVQVLLHAVCCN